MGGFLLILAVAVVVYLMTTYNKFQTTKTRIQASVQEIGNQLKRQADLIPNLVASVKGYMKHEQTALDKITEARKSALAALKNQDLQKMVDASADMQSALGGIQLVFESTPELKAEKPTVKLMDEVRDTADKLMYSRRTLIDLTADYNVMVVTLPSSLVANLFKFTQQPGLKTPETGAHLEVSAKETTSPKVEL
ncbi:LemA family protein [Patescibacteria group bacterium]|nr:LemA family protein [Patescibacteria group bacterium]MBU1931576.1 LemA family protein [Patescibacteria group bacterium]